jgi:hypothetical protein
LNRRRDRSRRERRRERDRTLPDPDPFDRTRALARWKGFLATATARGFTEAPFARYVLGPIIGISSDQTTPN